MAPTKIPHLCGGTLFDLFLETRKPRRKARNKRSGGTDGLTAADVYSGLIEVVTGEKMNYAGKAFNKCVSNYKNCSSSKSMTKMQLKDAAGISAASIAKLGKGGNITTDVLLRICETLNCHIEDILETIDE